ncbi:MAG: polyprenyl synthetase family protein [Anaerolineae bacterium]|nr:polyprenyl synthetase family protein [Anaerolineae bacterium]
MTTHEANPTLVLDHSIAASTALQAVENAMFDVVNSEVSILRDASRHILSAGGKRIRPRLLILAYLACGGLNVERIAAPAAAVELMHTASVVHDDINDHGVLRRGRPSVNAVWGRTFALLTGDFLFTAVYQLMAPYKDLNIILARAATALVEGETLQAQAVKENNFTREVYARIIALKTAALFQAAGEMGARLANAKPEVVEALSQYAYSLGMAFQIVDDILDVIGDEAKLGKTAHIDADQGRGFISIKDAPSNHSTADVMDSVKRKLMEGNRLAEARAQARAFVDMAIMQLDLLPASEARQELVSLAESVIDRDH